MIFVLQWRGQRVQWWTRRRLVHGSPPSRHFSSERKRIHRKRYISKRIYSKGSTTKYCTRECGQAITNHARRTGTQNVRNCIFCKNSIKSDMIPNRYINMLYTLTISIKVDYILILKIIGKPNQLLLDKNFSIFTIKPYLPTNQLIFKKKMCVINNKGTLFKVDTCLFRFTAWTQIVLVI